MDSRSANKTGTLVALSGGPIFRVLIFCSVLLPISVFAQDKNNAGKKVGSEAKAVSGMSIVGNNESPKSLYIVPWTGSQLGAETSFNSSLLDDSTAPVDKEVFMRALDYYDLSNAN